MKLTELQDQTEAFYPSPRVVNEIAHAVIKELGAQGYRPDAGSAAEQAVSLRDRVSAWERSRQPQRDQNLSPDLRPNYTISAESQWLRPEQNEVGSDGVIRPRKQVEGWERDYEWNQASTRMAGYFQRVSTPIYHEGDLQVAPGPNIPVAKGHKISY